MPERWTMWQRNVVNKYKGMSSVDIKEELQNTAHSFAVLMEHWKGDFNISTMLRNANAFNAQRVFYVGRKRWDRRGAVGVHHYTPMEHLKDYDNILALKDRYTFVAIDNNVPGTTELRNFDWLSLTKPPLMIFGEEGEGLSGEILEHSDYIVEIPQFGSVRSLNVGTSSGIVMYDYINKLKEV